MIAPLSTQSRPSSWNRKCRAQFLITSPRNPRSPTRMFAPRPRTKCGMSSSRAARIAAARSSAVVAV
jgi:hypothetical protein